MRKYVHIVWVLNLLPAHIVIKECIATGQTTAFVS